MVSKENEQDIRKWRQNTYNFKYKRGNKEKSCRTGNEEASRNLNENKSEEPRSNKSTKETEPSLIEPETLPKHWNLH
ncbi:Hypothetical protein FKW44_021916 [Caligus rogercresseyi]|uniref:Uncharacterized protein n=1 Tax=Caligus rogercresseyi TaxID=217165 RepID=A0A7T8JVH2_CALRO|nr:Hypothetical protein FKW44_021916 [Caligus rogercresseyi]